MTRPLLLLLLAAAVATAAALGVVDAVDPVTVAAAEDPPDASPPLPTDLTGSTGSTGSTADPDSSDRTGPEVTPRAVLPTRDLLAAAPDPEPMAAPDAQDTTDATAPRQLRGTGLLLAAAGGSTDPVDSGGRTVRFSVEVEQGTGLDPDAVAAVVETALYDGRSWAATHELQRVAPADAWLHVVIATPGTVDTLCARAGLNTAGWLSCWSGDTAAINLQRWTDGVAHVDDLATYRRYVVNHEVGHGLGFGHVDCPGQGRTAPVMQQQTKTLDGCTPNEWAYP